MCEKTVQLKDAEGNDYPEQMCVHGMCYKHNPDWEYGEMREVFQKSNMVIRLLRDIIRMMGWKFDFEAGTRCCGQQMPVFDLLREQHCKKCGRKETRKYGRGIIERCSCCGRHI